MIFIGRHLLVTWFVWARLAGLAVRLRKKDGIEALETCLAIYDKVASKSAGGRVLCLVEAEENTLAAGKKKLFCRTVVPSGRPRLSEVVSLPLLPWWCWKLSFPDKAIGRTIAAKDRLGIWTVVGFVRRSIALGEVIAWAVDQGKSLCFVSEGALALYDNNRGIPSGNVEMFDPLSLSDRVVQLRLVRKDTPEPTPPDSDPKDTDG